MLLVKAKVSLSIFALSKNLKALATEIKVVIDLLQLKMCSSVIGRTSVLVVD